MSQLPKKNSGSGSSGNTGNRQPSGGAKSDRSGSGASGGSGRGSAGGGGGGPRPANRQGGPSSGSGKGNRPSSYQSGGSRPPVSRQPVGRGGRPVSQQSNFRGNVDRTLPPFSTRRYLAIWIPLMIIVVAILLVLLFTLNNKPAPGTAAQPTVAAQNGGASGGATAAPQPATGGQGTSAPAPTSPPAPGVAVVTATESLTGTGTYMVIDTAKGKITCKLYTDPSAGVTKTVANFVNKAKANYFNGLIFHRVEDWVIQGGDPLGNGTGGGTMPSEYNNIPFGVGALGVARGSDPALNNDSQFFIVKDAAAAAGLVGQYTNFGQVVEGMDVVNKIAIGDKINAITIEQR